MLIPLDDGKNEITRREMNSDELIFKYVATSMSGVNYCFTRVVRDRFSKTSGRRTILIITIHGLIHTHSNPPIAVHYGNINTTIIEFRRNATRRLSHRYSTCVVAQNTATRVRKLEFITLKTRFIEG